MTITTPIETEYNLFYEPDVYNPPGSCVNDFKDIPDLIEYIEEQIQDVYLERNEFQDTHIGKDGQILDIATMTIRNSHNEEMDVKLFDRHLSRTQIRYELRQHLERIKEIFEHTEPWFHVSTCCIIRLILLMYIYNFIYNGLCNGNIYKGL